MVWFVYSCQNTGEEGYLVFLDEYLAKMNGGQNLLDSAGIRLYLDFIYNLRY